MIYWQTVNKKGETIWCLMFRNNLNGIRIANPLNIIQFNSLTELLNIYLYYTEVYANLTLEYALF